MLAAQKTDEQQLRAYLAQHWGRTPQRKMSGALGLTRWQLYRAAKRLGLAVPRRPARPWTKEEDQLLFEQAGLWSWARLGRELARTPSECRRRANRIKARNPTEELSAEDCGRLLGRDPRTIAAWIERGELGGRKAPGGAWRVWPSVLRAFVVADPSRARLPAVGDADWELLTLIAGRWGGPTKEEGT